MKSKGKDNLQNNVIEDPRATDLLLLREEVIAIIRNRLVFPNTILQKARDRAISPEESENAAKYIQGCVAMVDQKFMDYLNKLNSAL